MFRFRYLSLPAQSARVFQERPKTQSVSKAENLAQSEGVVRNAYEIEVSSAVCPYIHSRHVQTSNLRVFEFSVFRFTGLLCLVTCLCTLAPVLVYLFCFHSANTVDYSIAETRRTTTVSTSSTATSFDEPQAVQKVHMASQVSISGEDSRNLEENNNSAPKSEAGIKAAEQFTSRFVGFYILCVVLSWHGFWFAT